MSDTFKVRDKETGKVFTVRAKQKSQAPVKEDVPNKAFGLGKTDVVENLIEQRDPQAAFQAFSEGMQAKSAYAKEHPFKAFMKGLDPRTHIPEAANLAGGISQRIESTVANPLIEMQKGEFNPMVLGQSAIDGLIGKRGGEVGDIMRNSLYSAGVSPEITEAVAGSVGLLGMAGVYKGLGELGQNKTLHKGLDKLANKRPRIMNDKWKVNTSKQAHQGVLEAKGAAGKEYSRIYSPVDNKVVAPEEFVDSFKKIPQSIKNELAPEFKGKLQSDVTIKVLREIRKRITDRVSDSNWVKAIQGKYPSVSSKRLIDISSQLKKAILNNVDDATKKQILKLDPKYAQIVKKGHKIINNVYDAKTGSYKTSKTLKTFTEGTKAGERTLYSSYGEYSKALKQFVKDMNKYAFRQKAKAVSGKIAKWAAISGAVGGALDKAAGTNYLVDAVKDITGG